jgi:hypothetical protein
MKPGKLTLAVTFALASLTAVAQGATDRRVSGVITAVDAASMTLAPLCAKSAITGRLGPTTRITVNGHAGRPTDLRVTNNVKAELGLDDVWLTVSADNR